MTRLQFLRKVEQNILLVPGMNISIFSIIMCIIMCIMCIICTLKNALNAIYLIPWLACRLQKLTGRFLSGRTLRYSSSQPLTLCEYWQVMEVWKHPSSGGAVIVQVSLI